MEWHYLGHAMWLAQLGEVRVLFDPLLEGVHHGGVFEVAPQRTLAVEALRPDFLVLSHAHPDHFDVPSLARLARLDPDTVVFTSSELVVEAALAVGFRTVRLLEAWSRVDLLGAQLLTTPSYGPEPEWGMMVRSRAGVCWNQVDSYHPEPAQVRDTLTTASRAFGASVEQGLELALVRWQPVLESAAVTGEATGFPYEEYALALSRIEAVRAHTVVPSAAGVQQTAPYAWLNHHVYPVPVERVLRDLALRAPSSRALRAQVGATYRVAPGETRCEPEGASAFVRVEKHERAASTGFRPLELPALRDPNLAGRDEAELRPVVERWVRGALASGLGRMAAALGPGAPLRCVLEVVYPRASEAYTLVAEHGGVRVERRFDDDYDLLNAAAGSLLVEVLEGRRQWGDLLLGGTLRVSSRAYRVSASGLERLAVEPAFVYCGLSYVQSVERSVRWQLAQLASSSG